MECLICHKDFSALGFHLKAHQISCRDYKLQFNIPLLASLHEKWLYEKISKIKKEWSRTQEGKDTLKRARIIAAEINAGAKRDWVIYPKCSLEKKRSAATKGKERSQNRIFNNKELMRDFQDGVTFVRLSIRYGVPYKTLYKYLNATRMDFPLRRKYPISEKLKIVKDYRDGLTWCDATTKYGVSRASLFRWNNEFKDVAV